MISLVQVGFIFFAEADNCSPLFIYGIYLLYGKNPFKTGWQTGVTERYITERKRIAFFAQTVCVIPRTDK